MQQHHRPQMNNIKAFYFNGDPVTVPIYECYIDRSDPYEHLLEQLTISSPSIFRGEPKITLKVLKYSPLRAFPHELKNSCFSVMRRSYEDAVQYIGCEPEGPATLIAQLVSEIRVGRVDLY